MTKRTELTQAGVEFLKRIEAKQKLSSALGKTAAVARCAGSVNKYNSI